MKKYILIISLLFSVCPMRAQDTIYPFDEDYPFFNDSAFRAITLWGGNWNAGGEVRVIEHRNVNAFVSGLAIPFNFGTRYSPIGPDSISVQGVLIKIAGNDYRNPQVYYTNSVKWRYTEVPQVRPHDRQLAFRSHTDCGVMDTVIGAYSLYFDQPIQVNGRVFLGYKTNHYRENPRRFISPNEGKGAVGPAWDEWLLVEDNKCDTAVYHPIAVTYYLFKVDSAGVAQPPASEDGTALVFWGVSTRFFQESWNAGERGICPILTIPDTDSFSCPEVEGFAFAGIYAGYPTFVWDTAVEHTTYQLAYGPDDEALDSLSIVETTNRYVELTTAPLSRDIYYQARLRARCRHLCPLHDTVMWTGWSDPVYFYTGDSMPDTTHSHPIGIAPVGEGIPFAIEPNPASVGRMPDVVIDPGVSLQGMTLVLRDAAGREMLRMAVHSHRFALPVGGMPAGVYTVTLTTPRGATTLRMVVE